MQNRNIRGNFYYYLIPLLLLFFSFFPLIVNRYPPLVDYPLHASRAYLISAIGYEPFVFEHYELFYHLSPYIGFELITVPLLKVFSITTAMDIFIGLYFVLIFSGTVVLHRILFGKWSYWPFISAFLLFNLMFIWGLLPYLFGIAVMIWALAGWVYFSERTLLLRMLFGFFCGLILFFIHLAVLAVFGVTLMLFEGQRIFKSLHQGASPILKNLIVVSVPFILPFLMFLFSSPIRNYVINEEPLATHVNYSLGFKVLALPLTLTSGNFWIDSLALVMILFTLFFIFKHGQMKLSHRFTIVLIGLTLLYCLLPFSINEVSFVDVRLPIVIFFLFFAATDLTFREKGVEKVFYSVIFSFLIIRSTLIGWDWIQFDSVAEEYVQGFKKLPVESTLFVAKQKSDEKEEMKSRVTNHFGTFAAIVNKVFVPLIHVQKGIKIIILRDPYLEMKKYQGINPIIIKDQQKFEEVVGTLQQLQRDVDPDKEVYFLLNHEHPFAFQIPNNVSVINSGKTHKLFEVKR